MSLFIINCNMISFNVIIVLEGLFLIIIMEQWVE